MIGRSLGFSNILYWVSLTRYLTYDSKLAVAPNTIIGGAINNINGIIGLMPIFIGFSVFGYVTMNSFFRFRTPVSTLFTLFYNSNGDTLFDTLDGCNKWNPIATFVWGYFGVQFTLFILMKLSLAVLEEGYIFNRTARQFDWLLKPENIDSQKIENTDMEYVQFQDVIGVRINKKSATDAIRKLLMEQN